MPQVGAAIAAAAQAVASFVFEVGSEVGLSVSAAATVANVAYAATEVAITAGLTIGVGLLTAPKIPSPAALQTPLKEAMPVRQSAFGRVRVAGSYALYVAGSGGAKTVSNDVLALLDGRSHQVVSYYLNDDLMAKNSLGYWYAPGAYGKYGQGTGLGNLVQIDSRVGNTPETAYPISGNVPLWTSDHRGDGVTSMVVLCKQAHKEDQASCFPNGVPTPSAAIDSQLIFDPRDEAQTQGDASTYVFSDNPVLCLLAYLTDACGGMGLSYDRFIAPTIDTWIAAANECDGLVTSSGMHATLAEAAAAGDGTITLNDVTGLTAGVVITLPTAETVTVASVAGNVVTLTGDLTYAYAAGALAYWDVTGQQARYRCAGTYRHDNAPGDVIKSILSTFDGWIGQRGDGALVVRTNTIYEPSVTLTDRHIVGYSVQHYSPDEQAINQLVVSFTDPAAAFNNAEAGYVQDDADIAARGQVRSQQLQLDWVPSGPQAITVARAVLARSTQPLRGTLTCKLAGLAVMGERYVRGQVSELPALNNIIVEVTGKPVTDLSTMTVTFPWVAASSAATVGGRAVCVAIDVSYAAGTGVAREQEAVTRILNELGANISTAPLDLCIVNFGHNAHATTNITRRTVVASDISAMTSWVAALTPDATGNSDPNDAMNAAKTFFDATDSSIIDRRLIVLTDGDITGSSDATIRAAAAAVLASMTGVQSYVIAPQDISGGQPEAPANMAAIDNTPADGIPITSTADEMTACMERALFGTVASAGSGYTLPTPGPPSGGTLDPLTAPTITSVTPDYPDSGGGVSGARLVIVVVDPGLDNINWKVRWKLAADTAWTDAASTADANALTLHTGLVPASGSLDVQVAYYTATQTSPWSATSTVTVAAPPGGVASTSKSANFTTTADHNVYYLDTSGAAYTVTLNATPAQDEVVEVWDATGHAGAHPISFAGNGHNISGSSSVSNFIAIDFGHARLIYDGTQWLMQ